MTATKSNKPLLFLAIICGSIIATVVNFHSVLNLFEDQKRTPISDLPHELSTAEPADAAFSQNESMDVASVSPAVMKIAYAISITGCQGHFDGAAVLKHSIHLSSARNPSSGSHYDYEMFAFVHPVAENCTSILHEMGYQVQIRETPINITDIRGNFRNYATKNGCCAEKEWLKLYTFTLVDYPVAVHLDIDCLVLQPFDELFDSMIFNNYNYSALPIMWKNQSLPERIDAFFTRDYNLVRPGKRQPRQIGVQGGFLVVRPNQSTYDEFVELILEGDFVPHHGWGGDLRYGGYYGAGTIQGLGAYYYGHIRPGKAVELNRCVYNSMVDIPYGDKPGVEGKCKTTEETCEDCRETALENIKSVHYTVCFKPWKCILSHPNPWQNGTKQLCRRIHHEWFRIRRLLEQSLGIMQEETDQVNNVTLGYCQRSTYRQLPMANAIRITE